MTDINNFPISIGNAMGVVYAKTWYEGISEVNFHYKRELKTGITKQKIYFMLLGKKIYLKNDNIDFEKYDKIIEKNNLNIKGMNTKIEKITETYYQKIEENVNLTEEEAKKIAVENAENNVHPKLPQNGKLLDKKIYKEKNEKSIKVRILYLFEENIGIVQELK
ncbi:hypothetical protein Q428_09565 [Fervidicella metallireducens AeB]|uniref:Uncharacterized protein n=1 Tax=Fervidicella metallireducens AeB TaxID=1403537 RepID=A0A017RTR4_9CLOT|nr:hypothetical protein Q428_09565 [Fervidicella metallireducens AeB]